MAKSRRLRVLLDDEQWARLKTEADRRGVSVASLVRDAIDALVPPGQEERRRAGRRILDADPMPVLDPDALREELEEARERRT